MKKLLNLAMMFLVITGCSLESGPEETLLNIDGSLKSSRSGPISLGVPALHCSDVTSEAWHLNISAGQYGTPGGFKVEWMKAADYEAAGEEFTHAACSVKFDGEEHFLEENGAEYTLNLADFISYAEDSCFEGWTCEEEFVFRVRAENPIGNDFKASGWSTPYFCISQACDEVCLYGKGYWKNHGPNNPGNQEDLWPIEEYLELGFTLRDKSELSEILNSEIKGDALTSLMQQLIASKFNILIGGDDSVISSQIALADEIIANPGNYTKMQINIVKEALEDYNESSKCED